MQLPIDPHGEPAKTLQKRLTTVNVAAAPFSMLASRWDWKAGASSSADVLGSLADWFHQSAARLPDRTVSSVPNSRIDASAASHVRTVAMSSQPKAPTARAIAPPRMRSQVGPDLANIYYPAFAARSALRWVSDPAHGGGAVGGGPCPGPCWPRRSSSTNVINRIDWFSLQREMIRSISPKNAGISTFVSFIRPA
jgi:hypothetical protein